MQTGAAAQTRARHDCERALFQEKMPKSGVRNSPLGRAGVSFLTEKKRLPKCKGIFSPGVVFGPSRCQHLPGDGFLCPQPPSSGGVFLWSCSTHGDLQHPGASCSRLAAIAGLGLPLREVLAPAELCRGWREGLFCLGRCPQHRAGSRSGDAEPAPFLPAPIACALAEPEPSEILGGDSNSFLFTGSGAKLRLKFKS